MALREEALSFLREVFNREKVETGFPNADDWRILEKVFGKEKPTYEKWDKEDIGSLLSRSQNIMGPYCDYEEMDEYPDISDHWSYFANDATQEYPTQNMWEEACEEIAKAKEEALRTGLPVIVTTQFKQTGTYTGRISSSDPKANEANKPKGFDSSRWTVCIDEKNKAPETVMLNYAEPKFVPTKDNCGCSGYDLFHHGHKCGFFKN